MSQRLALHILYQRTDMERFFMDALETVRGEIRREDAQKRRMGFRKQVLLDAEVFGQNLNGPETTDNNNNQVEDDEEDGDGNEEGEKKGKKVDISSIAWKEKERVLRLLFAKMNGLVPDQPQSKALSSHQKQDMALTAALRNSEAEKREVEQALEIDTNGLIG